MNFNHFSNSTLIAYIHYFKMILNYGEDKNISKFLMDCEQELKRRNT